MTSECPEMSTVPDFQGGVSESNYTLAPDVTPPGKDGVKLSSSAASSMKGSASDTSHTTTPNNKNTKAGSDKKKKGSSWYNVSWFMDINQSVNQSINILFPTNSSNSMIIKYNNNTVFIMSNQGIIRNSVLERG